MSDSVIIQLISTIGSILLLYLGWLLNNMTKNRERNKKNEISLTQADFHTNVNKMLRDCENLQIPHLNNGRLLLVKDYYKNKVESFIEPAKIFSERVDTCCKECKKDCANCNQLLAYANDMLLSGLEYEKNCMNLAQNPSDLETMRVFNPKFIAWHTPHVDRFDDKIESICHSLIFKECNMRGHLILNELDTALWTALSEMIATASTLNGELTGKTWKGEIL